MRSDFDSWFVTGLTASALRVADHECDLYPVLHRQLGEQVAGVRFHRGDTDVQPFGDLRVVQSVRDGPRGASATLSAGEGLRELRSE